MILYRCPDGECEWEWKQEQATDPAPLCSYCAKEMAIVAAQASDEPPCPFCNGAPRHLRKLEGIYIEALICDVCNFGLAPEKWRQRAAIPEQASDEPMRAAFESKISDKAELARINDRYAYEHIQNYWLMWQIAWASALATPQPSGNTGELAPRATADVERDAARYRFLRDSVADTSPWTPHGTVWVVRYNSPPGQMPSLESAGKGTALDANIDAAMVAATKPGETT